jgi:Protein of unknown function (DUF4236)
MGFFRYRRSVKLFPGVRWNIGKKSSSLSFGGRGFHYTIGPRGGRTTVGIPGTGLSYTETSGHSTHPSPDENTGCAGCLGQIIVLLLVFGGISMCNRSERESSSAKPSTSASPQASVAPSVQSTPAPTATPTPFPESRYWPKKVRLLKSVEFSGSVSGGTVQSTVSAGTILPAHLSEDHQSLEIRLNELKTTVPLGDTDFLKRAVDKARRNEEP